ncbi:ENTH domain-containing protein 1 [Emydura macquarii macquarii]|uniref:ENTH domain-containing protein 1 n=1 Tax=Emydura macquarii macquarii TaxID=1129001 RepID=UPI00352BA811
MAFRRHMKNFVKNYSESEVKVREATSNDPWGPSSSLMLEISDLTYNTVSLFEIMNMIWHRMNDQGKNWRHVYKSLTLLDYLIKNGSKKVIQHCREGLFNIQTLKDFHYIDEAGKDQGYHVREKSKQVSALLTDDQLLHNEREIARRSRRRTSYAMILPKTTTTKDYSPTMSASEPIPELPDSVKVQLSRGKDLEELPDVDAEDVTLPEPDLKELPLELEEDDGEARALTGPDLEELLPADGPEELPNLPHLLMRSRGSTTCPLASTLTRKTGRQDTRQKMAASME